MSRKQLGAVDRLPIICAAGKVSIASESVGDLFGAHVAKPYVIEKPSLTSGQPATPIIPESNQLKDALAPDLNKSRFLEFKDQFYENLYCKKVGLGKPTPTNSKPDDVTNESRIFGAPIPKAEPAYGIFLPKKSSDQVLREYIKGHEKYKLSHGDYYPSEKVCRAYTEPFNPHRAYGKYNNVDSSGAKLKSIIEDFDSCSKMDIMSKALVDFVSNHKSVIGQPLIKHLDKDMPDKDTIFGRVTPMDQPNVKDLLSKTVRPDEITEYANVTTYRAFASDLSNSYIDCRGPAGQMESQYPKKGACKLLSENLGEETTAAHLISPSIPLHFGLSHRDFLLPCPKDQIRTVFTKAGYDLKDDEYFEKIWAAALTEWTSLGDQVSVEAFKYALQKIGKQSK